MTLVAHITDLHLVERDHHKRRGAARSRLLYLNSGRQIDPEARLGRVRDALRRAARSEHVVLTGDLTEDGTAEQFELLAEVLADSALAPERVTLVPGNHDLYDDRHGFERALRGPLRAFSRTSTPGAPVELAGVVVMPVSTALPQRFWFSGGAISAETTRGLHAYAQEIARRGHTLLVAQHHPPLGHRNPFLNWVDGMRAPQRNAALLRDHAHLHVAHGHTHQARSYQVRNDGPHQVHSGAAALSSSEHVRFYEASHGELRVLDALQTIPVTARFATLA